MAGKKGKPKKAPEPNEASKLIAARITQLEQDAAGEKDQEAEIGACLFGLPVRRLKGQLIDMMGLIRGAEGSETLDSC